MPLNPTLYRALIRTFKHVRIQKEAEPMVFRVMIDPVAGKKRIRVAAGRGGEDYKVCCPFCNDRRFRFEINHRWNTTDPDEDVYFGASFVRCYNDGCNANVDAPFNQRQTCHEDLVEMLKAYIARGHGLVTARPSMDVELRSMKLPEKCVPLDALPADHVAMRYLRERDFDPAQLSQDWRLQYCIDDPNECVAGRIIIPVYMDSVLVGWQARYIGTPPSNNIPKYYTAPSTPRNRLLYNYDRAKFGKFGVLVEGPTDAWRVGTAAAVAALGSSISMVQIQLMRLAWGVDGGVVVMLDPEYAKKPRRRPDALSPYERLMEQLRDPTAFANGVVEIVLADGDDPGNLTTPKLWEYIRQVAGARSFPLE
jgi:hypothetical protein